MFLRLNRSTFNSYILLLTLILMLFPALRHFSLLYQFALLALLMIIIFLPIFDENLIVKKINLSSFLIFAIFYILIFYVLLLTPMNNSELNIITGLVRILLVPTFILILMFVAPKQSQFYKNALIVYAISFVFAAFSYPYQFFTGPVEWFSDDPMERGLLLRYATPLGSGNIYGIGVGVALYISLKLINSKFIKLIIFIILLSGCFMSLQKAAVVNLIIVGTIVFLELPFKLKFIFILVCFGLLSCGLYLINVFSDNFMSRYIVDFTFNSIGLNLTNDPSLVRSTVLDSKNLLERFTGIHLNEIFQRIGYEKALIFGSGLAGGGGGMGYPSFLMAHNSYWDLLFMGGLWFLLSFYILVVSVMFNLAKCKHFDPLSLIFFKCNLIILINFFASSSGMFHPGIAIPFWLSLVYVVNREISFDKSVLFIGQKL